MREIDQPSTSLLQIEIDKISDTNLSNSNLDFDSLTDVIIDNITECEPTSAILDFCKRKFILPYVNLLGLVGLRPITNDSAIWTIYIGHFQSIFISIFLLIGYFLQFITCFRRDRGTQHDENVNFKEVTMDLIKYKHFFTISDIIFVYSVPSVLHFIGFFTAIYVFRIADKEQLQNLVERVFILSNTPKKLIYQLWSHLVIGVIWLILMTVLNYTVEHTQSITLKLHLFDGAPEKYLHNIIKILLSIALFIQDAIQIVVLSNYAIQCNLLRTYLQIIKVKLLQHTIEPMDWMREMSEFQKLLQHLNYRIVIPLCFFTIINLTNIFSGISYVFYQYNSINYQIKIFSLTIGNLLLWILIGLYPLFQAASLTSACNSTQSIGHQIRIRSFVHRNTSTEDLNSVLLYSSSLKLSAKLFCVPIKANYLIFILLCIIISLLTLGMCLNISIGIV